MNDVSINADRGEVGLTLGGHVYVMLPTFAAINAIEAELGPVAGLLGRFVQKSDLKFRELAVIATHCIRAAGVDRKDDTRAKSSVERVGELIYAEGLTNELLKSFLVILTNACTGGMTPKKAPAAKAANETATGDSPTAS